MLVTGADLMAVVEERIDFANLPLRNGEDMAQMGGILLQIHEMSE